METNRTAYSVSRKSPLLWLAFALMLCSVVARILAFRAHAEIPDQSMLLVVILPVLACAWYVGSLLCSGPERLYRTAVPALAILLFSALVSGQDSRLWLVSFWLCALAAAIAYFGTVSGRRPLRIVEILLLAGLLLLLWPAPSGRLYKASQVLMVLPMAVVVLAMQAQPAAEGEDYVPRWGDRPDGRLVRSLPPISKVGPYIMVERNGASNQMAETVEITELDRYVHEKRRQGYKDFSIMHVILAAYARTVCDFPAINRFLSGQKVYSRDRKLQVVMAIKKEMTLEAPDTMISVDFDAGDTALEIYEKFNKEVQAVKNSSELDSGFDNLAAVINYIPGLALKFTVWLLKTLDYFGLLPGWLLKLSPFHGSIIITSMGSLGIPPIFHHLYNFGNLPIFVAFGRKYRRNEVLLDGTVVPHKYMDFCFNCDERICDGFYYAAALRHMHDILRAPAQLDNPPEVIKPDIP